MHVLEKFLKQVRARSAENLKSFNLLYDAYCYGVCIGIIRQELDSLLRVSYLVDHNSGFQLRSNALDLVKNSVEFGEWRFLNANQKMQKVNDKEMIKQGGWEQIVYKFGCGLIHLSNKHLYQDLDPVIMIENEQKEEIIHYLKTYHRFEKNEVTMNDIIQYLPVIFQKIYENIDAHIEQIILINNETKVFED